MGYYTIKKGDSIYRMSVWFYYTWTMWPLLYYTNQVLLGRNPFVLPVGVSIFVPQPATRELSHVARQNENAQSLSVKYYDVDYYHLIIDEYNNWPIFYGKGIEYKIPALTSPLELDAAKELRKQIHVEFNRSN